MAEEECVAGTRAHARGIFQTCTQFMRRCGSRPWPYVRRILGVLLSPAFWSAVAAVAAAIAAWLSFVQQQRSAINAVRPELIVTRWEYRIEGRTPTLCIGDIENAGNGHAFHVLTYLERTVPRGNRSEFSAAITTNHIPILRVDERMAVNWEGIFAIPELPPEQPGICLLRFRLVFWDVHRNSYETAYTLCIPIRDNVLCPGEKLATGLYLVDRRTTVQLRSRWSTAFH